jgi:hypothetical protein
MASYEYRQKILDYLQKHPASCGEDMAASIGMSATFCSKAMKEMFEHQDVSRAWGDWKGRPVHCYTALTKTAYQKQRLKKIVPEAPAGHEIPKNPLGRTRYRNHSDHICANKNAGGQGSGRPQFGVQ